MNLNPKIKKIICDGNTEILDEIQASFGYPYDQIIKTRPLNAENIYLKHGQDVALAYIEICNQVDSDKFNEELELYLANEKRKKIEQKEALVENLPSFLNEEQKKYTNTYEYQYMIETFYNVINEKYSEKLHEQLKNSILQFMAICYKKPSEEGLEKTINHKDN